VTDHIHPRFHNKIQIRIPPTPRQAVSGIDLGPNRLHPAHGISNVRPPGTCGTRAATSTGRHNSTMVRKLLLNMYSSSTLHKSRARPLAMHPLVVIFIVATSHEWDGANNGRAPEPLVR
jgi:hypothetical protein